MKHYLLIFLFSIGLVFFSSYPIWAQSPEIIWEKGFGGNNDDRAMDVIETPDGGYLTVGYTNSLDGDITLNKGERDFYVVKTNVDGVIEWQYTYGGSENDYCYACLLYTSDAADERSSVDLGCRRIIKKQTVEVTSVKNNRK